MDKKQTNDNAPQQTNKTYKSPLEKDVPGLFSRLLFFWMIPMYYNGMKRDLEEHDLERPKHRYDSKIVGDNLEKKWYQEKCQAKAEGRLPSLKKVFIKTYWLTYLPGGILILLYTLMRTVLPLVFGQLLLYWSVNSTMTKETAAIYAAIMILGNWLAAFFNHHGNLYCQQVAMEIRVAVSSLMFRKIMKLNNASLGETAAGKVVNILSNDMLRFDLAMPFFHYIWIVPVQMVLLVYLGYYQAGVSALLGIVFLGVFSLPVQGLFGKVIGRLRVLIADKTDERIKVMTEVISGIQVIKMYAWEIPFQKVVGERRADELKQVKKSQMMRTLFLGFVIFTDRTTIFFTILVYILFGNNMTASVIFPLQQFMNVAQLSVTMILPMALSYTAELLVSIDRIQEFLCLEDREESGNAATISSSVPSQELESSNKTVRSQSHQDSTEHPEFANDKNGRMIQHRRGSLLHPGVDTAIELRNVTSSWTGDPNMCALKNISMRIRKGKLCAIIGAVGSGKSSILQLLLRELPALSGTVTVDGSISYASQEAWLFSSTVRENIIFGLPYDAEKYRKVCKTCCLEKDFKQFTFGDQTLVGEKGVSLSGGQRARINLARCIYKDSDIYLLDDPLSAVDANVGRLLFEGCINGYLRRRTRILVTHQIHFLKAADYIVLLNDGIIENMGTFDELINSGKEFSTLLASLQEGKDKDKDSVNSGGSIEEKSKGLLRSISLSEEENSDEFEAQKMQDEERASGNLKWSVIAAYFKAGGNICFISFTLFLVMLASGSAAIVDYWVSYWANNMAEYEKSLDGAEPETGLHVHIGHFTTAQYIIIHASLILICIFITNIRVFPFVALCVDASKNLHNLMFSNMIKGIMRFFDTSSSGRILNRFTKDMGALDEILPRSLLDTLQIYSTLVAILVLNGIALYWTLIPSAVLLVLFTLFVKIYLKTAQCVKRLEGTTKSPVFAMVSSTLNGISTIRSAGAEKRLIEEFDRHQDLHSAAWNSYIGGGCSFGFYLDTMCLIYLTVVIYIVLYFDFGNLMAIGSIGLAVTQSNTLTLMLQYGARMLVEFVAQLTSVERVLEYTRIETEQNLFEGQLPSVPNWPSHGSIEFDNVSMRYAPEEALVLKNLSFVIESGWKVGIVGRTGAGKSSIISALFRFAYIDGKISIDDIDTSLVAKQELRSKISIIPQEPVLFSATIRYNLDPFNIYSDADIWEALEKVNMKSAVQSLEFKVTEGGANFSVGQRQLLCLARAVLRSNKLLIMDEATANVDPQTDSFIQQTIRQHFKWCTVLTIAHRLNTIMDSDRVLVMSSGEVKEFDHPYILLSDPNSSLSSMVKETGDKNAGVLFQTAQDAFFQSNLKENA